MPQVRHGESDLLNEHLACEPIDGHAWLAVGSLRRPKAGAPSTAAPSMVNLSACVMLLLVPGEHRALCAVTSKIEKDAQAIFDFSHYFLRQHTPSGDKSPFRYRANCFA